MLYNSFRLHSDESEAMDSDSVPMSDAHPDVGLSVTGATRPVATRRAISVFRRCQTCGGGFASDRIVVPFVGRDVYCTVECARSAPAPPAEDPAARAARTFASAAAVRRTMLLSVSGQEKRLVPHESFALECAGLARRCCRAPCAVRRRRVTTHRLQACVAMVDTARHAPRSASHSQIRRARKGGL